MHSSAEQEVAGSRPRKFIRGGNDDTTTVVSQNVMSSLDVGGWVSAFLSVGRSIKTTFPGLDLKTVLAGCV